MSFGQRQAGGGTVRPGQPPVHVADGSAGEHVHPTLVVTFFGSIVAVLIAFVVYLAAPFTYGSTPVSYLGRETASLITFEPLMSSAARTEVLRRIGADFSLILRPVQAEHSQPMQAVAQRCLPPGAKSVVMPSEVYRTYRNATEYLVCALTWQVTRLCHPGERKHLVAQLLQFKERRQNVVALQKVSNFLMTDPMAQLSMTMRDAGIGGSGGIMSGPGLPHIDAEIPPRILEAIAALNRAGLLTASDFSPFGLYLPIEYEPALRRGEAGRAAC